MQIFSWLTRIIYTRTDLSMFDMHKDNIEDIGAECRKFMQKVSFVELKPGMAEGTVKGNEARTGVSKGGAQVSAS